MSETVRMIDSEDLFLWPCGAMCLRYEYEEFGSNRSDDFLVIPFDTDEYHRVLNDTEM